MPSITSAYAVATPAALGSMPACSQNATVGPFNERPPTNGLTATTGAGAARSASRIPGSARIGPIEMTGFDGPITIASASAIA